MTVLLAQEIRVRVSHEAVIFYSAFSLESQQRAIRET